MISGRRQPLGHLPGPVTKPSSRPIGPLAPTRVLDPSGVNSAYFDLFASPRRRMPALQHHADRIVTGIMENDPV